MTNAVKAHDDEAARLYVNGVSCWNAGKKERAVELIDAAVRLRPDFAEAYCMGAYILQQEGRGESALAFYRRAAALKPDLAVAFANSGKLLFEARRFDEALEAFAHALRLRPLDADSWNAMSCALRKTGRLTEALDAAERAIGLKKDFAEAALNRASALLKLDRMEEALAAYRQAGSLRKNFADALCGEALALQALDRFEESLVAFKAAERLGCREAISGRGCLQLTLGDFEHGLEGYEARWFDGQSLADALGARHPTWKGDLTQGLRLLVINDHGLGDTIQFCRYLPIITRAGLRPALLCPRRLHRLLTTCDARLRLLEVCDEDFDAQIALSSLPFAMGTRLETIPAEVPYLRADPFKIATFQQRMAGDGLKIGICWQGNPNPEADMARSMPLRAFEAIARLDGVRLFSLQNGFGREQIEDLPPSMKVETFGPEFDSGPDAFADTAAVIAHLDLVISCDTSVAHLAGALGARTWLALKKDAEWRWMRARDDSPWYPTMRLFRQNNRGDWAGVFEALAAAVAVLPRSQSRMA